jgi:hypothetical protein
VGQGPDPSTRNPEIRSLASGKVVTQFSVATNGYIGQGKEKAEYQSIVKVYRVRRASMYKGKVHGYAVTNPRPARWPLVR